MGWTRRNKIDYRKCAKATGFEAKRPPLETATFCAVNDEILLLVMINISLVLLDADTAKRPIPISECL